MYYFKKNIGNSGRKFVFKRSKTWSFYSSRKKHQRPALLSTILTFVVFIISFIATDGVLTEINMPENVSNSSSTIPISMPAPKNELKKIPTTTSSLGTLLPVIPQKNLLQKQSFLFGLGAQLGGTVNERLYREASISLVTSWYNNPSDLAFMKGWGSTLVPATYASGHSLHLIVWTGDAEVPIATKYGPACGRSYPFSATFADDMKQLATTFRGEGTLYVSMFTEFQTYPCQDNMWQGSENYYMALKDQYLLAMKIFKTTAPNAKVSLSWGGWQAEWDDHDRGGGKSLFPHFADVMAVSDFQCFQAMDSNSNVQPIKNMTSVLHSYGSGSKSNVMLAHYKPDNQSQQTWLKDLDDIFNPFVISSLQRDGLFAFSFMDETNINASESSYQKAKSIINQYSR